MPLKVNLERWIDPRQPSSIFMYDMSRRFLDMAAALLLGLGIHYFLCLSVFYCAVNKNGLNEGYWKGKGDLILA